MTTSIWKRHKHTFSFLLSLLLSVHRMGVHSVIINNNWVIFSLVPCTEAVTADNYWTLCCSHTQDRVIHVPGVICTIYYISAIIRKDGIMNIDLNTPCDKRQNRTWRWHSRLQKLNCMIACDLIWNGGHSAVFNTTLPPLLMLLIYLLLLMSPN